MRLITAFFITFVKPLLYTLSMAKSSTKSGSTKSKNAPKTAKAAKVSKTARAAKVTRNVKAAKATKPVKAVKAVKTTVKAKVSDKAKVSKLPYYLRQTQTIQRFSLFLFALLGIAAFWMMQNVTVPLVTSFMTKDVVSSEIANKTVFAPAIRPDFDIPLKWALITVLGISIIFAILHLTKWKKRFISGVTAGTQPTRWLELGITTALMIEIVATLSGIHDMLMLKLLAGVVVVTYALRWLAERENIGSTKPVKAGYFVSLLTGALPWLVILVTAVSTVLYGMVRAPWYVYALYVVMLGAGLMAAYGQRNQFNQVKNWKDSAYVERNFALLNLVTKTLFALILIVAFNK